MTFSDGAHPSPTAETQNPASGEGWRPSRDYYLSRHGCRRGVIPTAISAKVPLLPHRRTSERHVAVALRLPHGASVLSREEPLPPSSLMPQTAAALPVPITNPRCRRPPLKNRHLPAPHPVCCLLTPLLLLDTADLILILQNVSPGLKHWKMQQKDWLHRSSQTSRVLAFYGLTSPPYKLDALEPYMSQKALEIHWVKHHGDYVERLNKQLANSPLYGLTLDELVKVAYNNGNPFPEFNNAAQLWNHNFFWESMQPDGGKTPTAGLLQQIEKDFGSFPNFKDEFATAAMRLFGSGWVWLVLKPREKRLAVVRTSNAVNPLALGDIPIINLDMWEHAYYLDYKV
ncbi:hypothetical protein Taro_042820 [Colocasia esculenta]|uniref:superoxide dismutase n=1 Tax=Colocasia esculenta TaxID=4460 RepID=A0A843WXG5_COLES|nr:hypothetical protein [Colocasia esculenta]